MVNQEEINAHFIEIIQFLKSEYGYTQEFIVEKAKLGKSAISKIKNGENNVGDKTINKLCDAFEQINPDFFYGRSPYKTIREKKEAEMEAELKKAQNYITNMDESTTQLHPASHTDELIKSLKEQLADKDRIIRLLEQKVEVLEAMQHIDTDNPLRNFPFKIGVSEEKISKI